MKLEIRQITGDGADMHFSETAEEMEITNGGVKFPNPIEVDLSAMLSGDEIICQGEIYTTVEVECSRCLDIFDMAIKSDMHFVIQLLDATTETDTDGDEDYEVIPKTQNILDISQRVRDAILLSIPLKPLCDEACKGLCPSCGANLNDGDCGCRLDRTDERWDALKNLFNEELE
jgi:uncharacterized protein